MSGTDSESAGADDVDASTVEDDTPDSDDESDQAGVEFVKRKFSLTREVDDTLDSLADDYHGGNRSRCVRCAIRDHERTQEGEDELVIKALNVKVEKLIEELNDLQNFVKENVTTQPVIVKQSLDSNNASDQIESEDSISGDNVAKKARLVLNTIKEADSASLSKDSIVDQSELSKQEVRLGITHLVNKDMLVEDTESTPPEYQLKNKN